MEAHTVRTIILKSEKLSFFKFNNYFSNLAIIVPFWTIIVNFLTDAAEEEWKVVSIEWNF